MTKRILPVVVVALALASSATASSPLRGIVVGTGNGVVFVAAPGGKVTMLAGHAKLGTRVVFRHGHLVAVVRPQAAKAAHIQLANTVRRNDDDRVNGESQIELVGVVAAVGVGTVTLNVGGQMLTVQLPAGFSVPASFVGRTVKLELQFAAAGVLPGDDANDDHGGVVTTPGHDFGDDHGGHGGDDHGGHGGSGRH